MKLKSVYGECSLCDWVGTVEYHHLISKKLTVKNKFKTSRAKLYWEDVREGDEHEFLKSCVVRTGVETLMIPVCKECHRKLHPENKPFYLLEDGGGVI